MDMDLAVFDLDGTLVASLEGIQYSMNKVLMENDFPTHDLESYRLFVGDGLKMVVVRSLPLEYRDPKYIETLYAQLLDVYSSGYAFGMHLYPEMAEALDGLVERKIRLAVNTNKNQNIAQRIVDTYLKDWPILRVAGSLADRPKKPDPAGLLAIMTELKATAANTIYIGDTAVDINTARNAGVPCISVTYGFRTRQELMTAHPDILVDSPQKILQVIDKGISAFNDS
ncbi:HAD family hydrolase [Alkalibacter rhizosphaerae]|uniref:HAD family hydrolase n=1 Tax=Alkalibacter rhizosphaerae TaxID=2815577 RepID=A0A974XFN6_9FIRM|nr:HAD family hydrolase [Alkalibacter rhizosphaerae]QSX08987.1 HAD family hydrolase [Alkalibacter rhizosphaerae]